MQKRRLLFYGGLLVALIVVGLAIWPIIRAYRQQQANQQLIVAIKANHISAALAAIKAGADPNTRENAPASRSFTAFLKLFLNQCFHPPRKPAPGADNSMTPLVLHFKVNQTYDPSLVKALLDAGADPHATYKDEVVPLLSAAMNGDTQNVRLLLQHGVDPNRVDDHGLAALEGAAMGLGHSITDKATCFSLLLNAGADVNARDPFGDTALMVACSDPRDKEGTAIRILLQHQADPNFRDGFGHAALDLALERDNARVVKLLRQAGAKTGKELMREQVERFQRH